MKYLGPTGVGRKENSQMRDFGIIMSYDASFIKHIHQVAAVARKYAAWIQNYCS